MPEPPLQRELLGIAEVAQRLELSKGAVQSRRSHGDFPLPVAVLACGPIWSRADLILWARDYCKRYSVAESAIQALAETKTLAEEEGDFVS